MRNPDQGKHYEFPVEKAERVVGEIRKEDENKMRVIQELLADVNREAGGVRSRRIKVDTENKSITIFDKEGNVAAYFAGISDEEMSAIEDRNTRIQALQGLLAKRGSTEEQKQN